MVTVHSKKICQTTAGFCDIIDVTGKLEELIKETKIRQGSATLFVAGSTAALTTIEYEPGLIEDLKEFVEKFIPSNHRYHHDDRWGDNNGFSHLRAALLGPSLAIPISNGRAALGTWQQVVLIDFDNRPRSREVIVQVIGEIE